MQFSDTSDEKAGLIQDCETIVFNEYGKITGNSDLLATFTNNLNRARDDARFFVMENDGDWVSDDTSYTDTSTITADLADGQAIYTLDDDTQRVMQVRIKDQAGNWSFIDPVSVMSDQYKARRTGAAVNTEGIPNLYTLYGDQIELLPTPNYSSDEGMEMRTQRVTNYYLTTDTTKETGLASMLDRVISINASLMYAIPNRLDAKNDLFSMLEKAEDKIKKHYSHRLRGKAKFIRAAKHTSR